MASSRISDPRRQIPPVDQVLAQPSIRGLTALYGREQVRVQVRAELDAARRELAQTGAGEVDRQNQSPGRFLAGLEQGVRRRLQQALGPPLRRVLNATGILLHTNLGRAPLPRAVAEALPRRLDAYCDLELDLETGRRGDRNHRAERLLTALTGAEAALVVNNNAAALLLALAAHAEGREVVVSRGELVEIGGSFRIPEILKTGGARLVEVGTTNRTRERDYEQALSGETALLLKVYPSNYRISGFVEDVSPAALARLGRRHGLATLIDEGSGLLVPYDAPQLADHPSFRSLVVDDGCDLVCGSGDKLLGGPQAGLLVGRREAVQACRRHPLYRPLRPDRAALATLEEVLRGWLSGATKPLDGLWPDPEAHRVRLVRAAEALGAEIVEAEAFIGGGSAPERPIPGEALALDASTALAEALRSGEKPVVGYLREGRLVLDLRTVDPADDGDLIEAVLQARHRVSRRPAERTDLNG